MKRVAGWLDPKELKKWTCGGGELDWNGTM
jgi:hypothetical protein